jgi:hypothetical protein
MGSYQNSITPPDPYDRYRIDAVGRERHTGNGGEPPEDKGGWAVYFLKLFHRILTLLSLDEKRGPKRAEGSLRSLKDAFETLKREDRSEDIAFLNDLSQSWQNVLEESLLLQRESELSSQYKTLIKKIQHFPEHQTHTFGYYLSEYAGQKWIPFPYMELIKKIHSEYEKNPAGSALTEWTALIDQVILQGE